MGDDLSSIFGRLVRCLDYDAIKQILQDNIFKTRQYVQDCSVGYMPYKSKLHVNTSGHMKTYNHHIRSQLKQKRRNRNDHSASILR